MTRFTRLAYKARVFSPRQLGDSLRIDHQDACIARRYQGGCASLLPTDEVPIMGDDIRPLHQFDMAFLILDHPVNQLISVKFAFVVLKSLRLKVIVQRISASLSRRYPTEFLPAEN